VHNKHSVAKKKYLKSTVETSGAYNYFASK